MYHIDLSKRKKEKQECLSSVRARKNASKIILRVSVPLFLVGLILLFIPKSPFFFIKTADKINYCDVLCNKSNTSESPDPFSVESLTILKEEMVPLLERLEKMRVQYNGQYRYISFDKGECIYRFCFMSDNSELGEITIDENGFFYVKNSRYKILGDDNQSIAAFLRELCEAQKG